MKLEISELDEAQKRLFRHAVELEVLGRRGQCQIVPEDHPEKVVLAGKLDRDDHISLAE